MDNGLTMDCKERLRSVAGKQTLVLTHYGRSTGKPHEVTIWFLVKGEKIYLTTANVQRQWVRNVQKTPHVKLSIGDATFEGEACFLGDVPERKQCSRCFTRNTGCIGLSQRSGGCFREWAWHVITPGPSK